MLKKILPLFALSCFGLLSLAPAALAVTFSPGEDVNITCPFTGDGMEPLELPYEADGNPQEQINTYLKNLEKGVDKNTGQVACGEPNPAIGNTIEKRDCSKEDPPMVITEVNELIGPQTNLGDDGRILNLYRGLCCLVSQEKADGSYECVEERTIYTEDYETCAFGVDGNGLGAYCEQVQWLISTPGTNLLKLYLKQMYIFAAGFIGFGAVMSIIIAGVQLSVTGSSGGAENATNAIWQAVFALLLLFGGSILLNILNPNFFTGFLHVPTAAALEIPKPDYLPGPPQEVTGGVARDYFLNQSIPQALNVAIGILGLVAFASLIIAALTLVTAYGASDKIDKAKSNFRYALIGFLVVIFAYAAVSIVVSIVLPSQEAPSPAPNQPVSQFLEQLIPSAAALDTSDLPILLPDTKTLLNGDDRVNLPSGDALTEVFPAMVSTIMFAFGFLLFVALIYGGMMLVFSGGNEENLTKAKSIIQWSAFALALLTLGFGVIYGIATLNIFEDPQSENDVLFPDAPLDDQQLLP